jgi:hypothetical protein
MMNGWSHDNVVLARVRGVEIGDGEWEEILIADIKNINI